MSQTKIKDLRSNSINKPYEKRKETVKEILQVLVAKELTVSESEEVLENAKYVLNNIKFSVNAEQIDVAIAKLF
ncbi:MAG: hypothetical protein AB9883_07955 [Acidaminococcaceae bacterium]